VQGFGAFVVDLHRSIRSKTRIVHTSERLRLVRGLCSACPLELSVQPWLSCPLFAMRQSCALREAVMSVPRDLSRLRGGVPQRSAAHP